MINRSDYQAVYNEWQNAWVTAARAANVAFEQCETAELHMIGKDLLQRYQRQPEATFLHRISGARGIINVHNQDRPVRPKVQRIIGQILSLCDGKSGYLMEEFGDEFIGLKFENIRDISRFFDCLDAEPDWILTSMNRDFVVATGEVLLAVGSIVAPFVDRYGDEYLVPERSD